MERISQQERIPKARTAGFAGRVVSPLPDGETANDNGEWASSAPGDRPIENGAPQGLVKRGGWPKGKKRKAVIETADASTVETKD
jgi:hypothetical protein